MLFIENLISLTLEAAPWLFMGLIVASFVSAFSPDQWLNRHLNGSGMLPVIKAALIGAPLPLCSCGVIPAALALRRAGASKRATVSFLVATPETGVDSVAVTYGMLGPVMAIVRPIAAISSAIFAGLLVGKFDSPAQEVSTAKKSCCSGSNSDHSDQHSDAKNSQTVVPFTTRILNGLRHSFSDVLNDIALWLAVGLLLSAALKTFIPPSFLAEWGSGLPAMLMMILIGIPMYICATASTPIAAGLTAAGISPGTALVFLLAGPATNISTLGIIGRELGRHPLFAYLAGVVISSLLFGSLTDKLFESTGIDISTQIHHAHIVPTWLSIITAIVIIFLALRKPLQGLLQFNEPA